MRKVTPVFADGSFLTKSAQSEASHKNTYNLCRQPVSPDFAMSILNIGSLHFADPPTLPKDRKNYKDGGGRFDVRELPDIDITEVGSDMTVMSRTDVEA
ncbi:hypothetical protein EDD17DRAFT_1763636 [Pisolithus thermaeus]|nr:hypothetical protein EDD17DRAFT_1763636 [Pisolithus thermaeus]